jgi:IS30 family transposase
MKVTSCRRPRLLQSAVKALHRRSSWLAARTEPTHRRGGSGLSTHTPTELDAVAAALNSRPRKTLGYKTPAEALNEHLLCLAAATA